MHDKYFPLYFYLIGTVLILFEAMLQHLKCLHNALFVIIVLPNCSMNLEIQLFAMNHIMISSSMSYDVYVSFYR